ncbi:MAG: hypothetical protein IKC79_01960, partial [Clostridia bacterium]|nr:hypothetical protein [Clostridia bacterium]
FNPDKSVATNSVDNIILRSYSNWWTPISGTSSAHLQTYYGFGTLTGSTNKPTQKQLLEWSNNLTTEWQNYAATNTDKAQYTTAAAYGVQGENWHKFVYNLLYFVKYADNNSQEKVGYGNTYTDNKYSANGIVIDVDNQSIATGGSDGLSRLESVRGSSVIGLYGSANTSAGENITYNAAGMAYGNQGGDYYSQTYLTYNNGSKKVLLDGYVGSDKNTSVWCLGVCNPWGNSWKHICGVVISFDIDTNKRYAYVNFDNYDYSSENYVVSHSIEPWETVNSMLISKNYVCLSYNLALSGGYYSYLDVGVVSSSDGRQSLIGLLSDKDIGNKTTSTGLCDYWAKNNGDYVCDSLEYGGMTLDAGKAGINNFSFGNSFNSYNQAHTIRTMLMS